MKSKNKNTQNIQWKQSWPFRLKSPLWKIQKVSDICPTDIMHFIGVLVYSKDVLKKKKTHVIKVTQSHQKAPFYWIRILINKVLSTFVLLMLTMSGFFEQLKDFLQIHCLIFISTFQKNLWFTSLNYILLVFEVWQT